MKRAARRPLVVLPLVLSLAASAVVGPTLVHVGSLAHADVSEEAKNEARTHYDRGIQLYKEAAYEAALVEFERAYQLVPSYRILYNMGQIRYEMNDFAAALKLFRRYLVDGKGKDLPADRKAEVEKLVSQLELRVATLTIAVDTPDALVSIDDVPIGKSPLPEPVLVNIGYRKITATKDGKADSKVVTIAGGDKVDVALSIGAPATKDIVEPPPPPKQVKSVPWVPWAITGVLAASAVTMGILTLQKGKNLSNERDDPNASRESLDSALSKEKTFAIATDALAAGTLLMGGISLYLTLSRNSTTSDQPSTGVSSFRVGVGPGSVALSGAF